MNRHDVTETDRHSAYTRRRFVQVAAVAGASTAVACNPLLATLTANRRRPLPAAARACRIC